MDELVNQVSQKTGISQEQAREAVNTVIGFIKDKLPEPLAGQIDGLLGSPDANKTVAGLGENLGDSLGGLLGK